MITRILEPRAYSKSVLDYNESKVLEGKASLVRSRNLEDDCMPAIYDTFERYESNPKIVQQLRWRSFHMAVNPAPEDNMSEQQVLDYIDDVMEALGYAAQPYVVYRHNDIDREHYHVASVRVDKDGKSIPIGQEGLRILGIQRRLSAKYGFTVGRQETKPEQETVAVNAKEFKPGAANTMGTLAALFIKALQYEFHSLYQFHCILESMNIGANQRRRKDGGVNFIIHGVDDTGKTCTRYYSLERHLKIPGMDYFNQRLAQNNALGVLGTAAKEQLVEMSNYCLEHSGSQSEYESMLRELGVTCKVLRNPKTNDITRVTLVEKRNMTLVDSDLSGELYFLGFADAEKSGKWQKPEKPGKGNTAATAAVTARKRFFNEARIAELNERIRARVEAFGGKIPAQAGTKKGGMRLK